MLRYGPLMLRHAVVILALRTLLSPTLAAASPLEDPTLSGADVFTGVTHPHATSIYLNPAAIGMAGVGWHLHTGGSLRLDDYNINRRRIDQDSGAEIAGPQVNALTMTPSGIVAGYLKAERIAIGITILTPMAERFIADQEALRYHTLGGYHYQYGLGAGLSYHHPHKWYFGAGLFFFGSSMRLRFARDSALEAGSVGIDSDCDGSPCGIENDAAAERYDVEVDTDGFQSFDYLSVFSLFATSNLALSVGIMWRVRGDWWLAGAYQGPPGILSNTSVHGDVDVVRAPRDGAAQLSGEAVVNYNLPHTFHLGARGPIRPGYELVGEVRYQTFNSHNDFDLRMFGGDLDQAAVPEWYPRYRGGNRLFRLQAGIERQERGRLRFGARLGWENAAVDANKIAPTMVTGMRFFLALGGELRLAQPLALGASYQFGWFPGVNSTGSLFNPLDRIACVDSQFDQDACQAAREGRALPTAAGEYGHLQHILALSLRYDFL